MLFFIGQVFPYIAAAVFIIGMSRRVIVWLKAPVPFQLTLFPAPETTAGRVLALGRETLLFRSLRRGDNGLWFWAWLLHVCLALIVVGHIVGIYYLTHQFTMVGLSDAASTRLSVFLGTVSGTGLFIALLVLLYRRTAVEEVKRLSDPADFFDLLLLLSVVVTGMHMRTVTEVNLVPIRAYLGSLFLFHPLPIPWEPIFISHFFLVNLLLLYFPFSKLVHAAGFFVNRTMLMENAPVYPTRTGIVRDVRVIKGGAGHAENPPQHCQG
ncbi:nitrate reductase gamma subunit [Lucifera butyrica]|uniref:Nitrate reductase gamma subunit n=1 Tax=Lucifera butyrica TaxID=1351585 RepID=A0A498R085_9FIRM|nr:respiratory nitrate reductase subunit gamma [Lucifera butyrica]VBB05916.1 nitrate reductase gamma subunit [Lucifera butyrica]